MPHYRSVGSIPQKRHTRHLDPDGRPYYEELFGEEGFSASSSLLYHREVPAAVVATCPGPPIDQVLQPNHPLRPRHLRTRGLFPDDRASGGASGGASGDLVVGAGCCSPMPTFACPTSSVELRRR